ncbi:MAG: hypothetical protein ABJN26_12995 [Stappiaceae bacterium]
MKKLLVALFTFSLIIGTQVRADVLEAIASLRTEIEKRKAAHDGKFGPKNSEQTMRAALGSGGVDWATRYAPDWSNWVWVNWSHAKGFYATTQNSLRDWEGAARGGRVDEGKISDIVRQGRQAFLAIDQDMDRWFQNDLDNYVERALYLDKANAIGCCEEAYKHLQKKAKEAFSDSIAPDYKDVADFAVMPPVPQAGQPVSDMRQRAFEVANARAEAAINAGDPVKMHRALQEAERVLRIYPSSDTENLAQVLALLNEQMRFAQAPVSELLDQASTQPPGDLRNALLAEAHEGLLDRMGYLAPIVAARDALRGDEERASAVTRLLAEAQRFAQLTDDLENPGITRWSNPSTGLRAVNGFKAAAELLDAAGNGGDPRAKELLKIVNDAAGTFKTPLSPTAAFAVPASIVAAQLDQTRSAWDHASDALDGVADAIGGDPSGLQRSEAAAQRLERALDPEAFAKSMSAGFVDGITQNVPFGRSILSWLQS